MTTKITITNDTPKDSNGWDVQVKQFSNPDTVLSTTILKAGESLTEKYVHDGSYMIVTEIPKE